MNSSYFPFLDLPYLLLHPLSLHSVQGHENSRDDLQDQKITAQYSISTVEEPFRSKDNHYSCEFFQIPLI